VVRTYETVFITQPTLTEDEERTAIDALAEIVSSSGGVFTANDRMGRRRLAYPIQKFEDGVYTRFLYDSEPAVPKELDRRLRISDKVIRHMTVRLEPDWAVAAKEQAVRDAQIRAETEAARAAGLLPEEGSEGSSPERRGPEGRDDDESDFEERD
jgi:small subunit ribosomal protein S6